MTSRDAADLWTGRTEASVRAGLFALVGSLLAALGHHAVVEGPVPWRLMTALAAGQFVLVWPFARRPMVLMTAMSCTLAAQAVLHTALTAAGGSVRATAVHTAHAGAAGAAAGDGHAWHHAGVVMTTAHTCAVVVAAWLLQRADRAVVAALAACRIVRAAATAVIFPTGLVTYLTGGSQAEQPPARADWWPQGCSSSLTNGPPRWQSHEELGR